MNILNEQIYANAIKKVIYLYLCYQKSFSTGDGEGRKAFKFILCFHFEHYQESFKNIIGKYRQRGYLLAVKCKWNFYFLLRSSNISSMKKNIYYNNNKSVVTCMTYYTIKSEAKLWRLGIVVKDFDCCTGDRSSIPTRGDSLGKWMNLRLGQPMPCEGNWVVSPRCWQDINYKASIIAKMGFSASCNSTI